MFQRHGATFLGTAARFGQRDMVSPISQSEVSAFLLFGSTLFPKLTNSEPFFFLLFVHCGPFCAHAFYSVADPWATEPANLQASGARRWLNPGTAMHTARRPDRIVNEHANLHDRAHNICRCVYVCVVCLGMDGLYK